MKNNMIKDERVLNQRRKISSEATQVLMYGLLIAIIVQSYFMNSDFDQVAGEFIVVMIASAYIIIRNFIVGNDLFNQESKWQGQKVAILNSIVTSITITAVSFISNYLNPEIDVMVDVQNTIIITLVTLISSFVGAIAFWEVMYFLNVKVQKSIDSKYDKED